MILASVVLLAFQIPSYTDRSNFPAMLTLVFMYCLTTSAAVYNMEKMFDDASMGQMMALSLNILTGILCMLLIMILQMLWWMKVPSNRRIGQKIMNCLSWEFGQYFARYVGI